MSAMQLQRAAYLLEDVPLESLGHPRFVDAASERKISGLSVGPPFRGQSKSAVALLGASATSAGPSAGPPRLCAALTKPSFQRLGLEEPLPGRSDDEVTECATALSVDLPCRCSWEVPRSSRQSSCQASATSSWTCPFPKRGQGGQLKRRNRRPAGGRL